MSGKQEHPVGATSTGRIEALCDGVFAIIMTILVFDIKLPQPASERLLTDLPTIWPGFLGYVVSFWVLGVYWLGHHAQYQHIRYANQNLHWLNFLFFAISGLIPFSTGLVTLHHDQWLAVAIYGTNMVLIGVALYLHWLYATRHPILTDESLPPGVVVFGTIRCLFAPIWYAIAIVLGLLNPRISWVLFAFVPIIYTAPPFQGMWFWLSRVFTRA